MQSNFTRLIQDLCNRIRVNVRDFDFVSYKRYSLEMFILTRQRQYKGFNRGSNICFLLLRVS